MLNKSIVFIGLLVFSTWGFADDLVSRQSIKAKVVNIEIKKTSQEDEEVFITLEINKEVKSYPFSSFRGENVFYKANLSPLPIKNIKIGRIYNIEMGKFSVSNRSSLMDKIYYIGERVFSFGELE
jgi:hypothetical protein